MSAVRRSWDRFWFTPYSIAPLILIRAVFGLLVFLWALSVLPDAKSFFGPDGVLNAPPHRAGAWSLFDIWDGDAAAVTSIVVLGAASLFLAAGVGARVASVLVFAIFVSLGTRNPFVGNSGDGLLRVLSLYVMVASFALGPSPSISARRPIWPLRLFQVQLSVIYIATVWAKLRGVTWPDGTAVSYAFRLEDLARFPLPDVGASLAATHVLTYLVLATELAIGVLVWNRRLRPWVLLAGVCLHLGIEYRLRVGFFSWAMLTTYLAFVPGHLAERVVGFFAGLRSRAWVESASTS